MMNAKEENDLRELFSEKDAIVMDVYDAVTECEEIQHSNESRYTKQCAIETAYKKILQILIDAKEIYFD